MSSQSSVVEQFGESTTRHTVYRKAAVRIIPFLMLCYFSSYLDRINIGFAKLQMQDSLGFSSAVYGLGAGLFFIGYLFFEIPSNMYMMKIGAKKTICRISAVPLSGMIGAPLSGAILDGTHGAYGLQGWHWMFALEAIPSLILGFLCLYCLSDSPKRAGWLNPQERQLIMHELTKEAQDGSRAIPC